MKQVTYIANGRAARRGFTILEAAVATVLVGVMLTAALSAAGAAAVAQYRSADRSRGRFLAQSLMSEILSKYYIDPGSTPTFGPEAGETTSPPSRSKFNDVDDYNNWSEWPPQNADGTALDASLGTWGRSVSVCWVSSSDLTTPVTTSDTGVKRITVTVTHNNLVVYKSTAIKANGW